MNKWKVAFFGTLVSLLLACFYLSYLVVDTSISLSYLQDSYGKLSQDFSILKFITDEKEFGSDEIENKLKQKSLNYFNVSKDTIHLNNIALIFNKDSLVEVVDVNHY